jgi:hypothetical protein
MSDEQYNKNLLKTTRNKPIADAILNRKKITFYYTGPRRPKKDNVKAGYRVKVEPVAMGLNKKGNLVLRAWVDKPSTSKRGFEAKTVIDRNTKQKKVVPGNHWRTFILSRTSSVQVTDETFDVKRPGYNEDGDKSMSVVYVKTDWGKAVKPKKEVKPKAEPTKVTTKVPKKEPEVEPEVTPTELPTPEPKTKPSAQPTGEVPPVEKPTVEPKPTEVPQQEKPTAEPVAPTNQNLPQPKPEEKPPVNPEDNENQDDENQLNESILKIKRLMFY